MQDTGNGSLSPHAMVFVTPQTQVVRAHSYPQHLTPAILVELSLDKAFFFFKSLLRAYWEGRGMAFLSKSSWMWCPSYDGFLNGVLQRMYKSIFSTCSTRRMKGPRLCQQCSGGLSEYHSFIVRTWPNLGCIYGVGGENGPVSDYFWALNVLTGFV